jgi:hypothetical protein
VGQLGFFDLNRRYEGLNEKNDGDRGDGSAVVAAADAPPGPIVPDGAGGFVPFTQSRVMPDGTLRPYDSSIDGVMLPDGSIVFPGRFQSAPRLRGSIDPANAGRSAVDGDAAIASPEIEPQPYGIEPGLGPPPDPPQHDRRAHMHIDAQSG